MAINNVNEFLRKTFSKTIFGTPALRPIAVCADDSGKQHALLQTE